MNEIPALIGRANKYLRSAALLIEAEDFESSVSRSYYAMLFATEALLLTRDLTFSSHRGVISAFGRHFVKTGLFPAEMRVWLQNAFDQRQRGDYFFEAVMEKSTAETVLTHATAFISKIAEHLEQQGLHF